MLYLWDCRPVSPEAGEAPSAEACRGPRRRERVQRLTGKRRAETVSAEALCRELWERFPGKEAGASFLLEEDGYGKPCLLLSPLYVSLSHSGGFAAAAVGDVSLGIDLQVLRPVSLPVQQRLYSSEERDWIAAAAGEEAAERALRLWTMKEARGKLRGSGIFGGRPFCASFTGESLQKEYADCRFFFLPAPEGLFLTLCLADVSPAPEA